MAANINPIFVIAPNIGRYRSVGANTASDGSGINIGTLFTAAANGSLVRRIDYSNSQATAAASSPMVARVWIYDGSNYFLYKEVAIPGVTRSATVVGVGGTITLPQEGLLLPATWMLKVAQSVFAGVQDQMDYIAEGGDY